MPAISVHANHGAGKGCVKAYNPYPCSLYQNYALKQLTRFRSDLVWQRSRFLVQLTNVCDCVFPEFKPFFNKKFSVTAMRSLSLYPSPVKIANMDLASFDNLRRISHGKFTMPKFVALKELAGNTFGVWSDFYISEIGPLAKLTLSFKVANSCN
ncbi:hypothetical protein FACS18949_12480 [Clostridia bacterium]|nr:hypothetical protein FACS189425_09640 [Clostridia bacterium]GHV35133.1 hypothetical protein FACS18949_12480 [Clostridia bacterium]